MPGQQVSSFIKGSNKIWEGIIIDRSDGEKVVLNETTNNWKKLSDLEHIKRIGKLLYEDQHQEEATDLIKDFNSFTQSTLNKGDEDDLEKVAKDPSSKKQLSNHLITISKANPDIKDTPSSPDEAEKTVDENLVNVLAAKKSENAPGNDAAIKMAQEETEKLIGKQVQETLDQLHPNIKTTLKEMSTEMFKQCKEYFDDTQDEKKTIRLLIKHGMTRKAALEKVNKWKDLLISTDTKLTENEKKPKKVDQEESINYENEDYLDIPNDVKIDVISRCKDLLADDQADIEEVIKSSFELTDEDAEEFIIQAMEEYINETDVEPRDSIKSTSEEIDEDDIEDDIEKDFEDTIDSYKGPDNELLDFLVEEYEIDPNEAEKIYDSKNGDLTECIMAFVDIVKNKLKESLVQ
jgi:hypothetical protein